jgi:hypothetical protein
MADDATEDDEDLGEPIAELSELREDPSPGFITRILGALRRRNLGSQLATFGWTGLGAVFVEFVKIIFSVFETDTDTRGGAD